MSAPVGIGITMPNTCNSQFVIDLNQAKNNKIISESLKSINYYS